MFRCSRAPPERKKTDLEKYDSRRRAQRHHLSHYLRPPSILHPFHWLHSLEKVAPRTATCSALVPGPCRNGNQHHRVSVFVGFFCFLLLPDCNASPAGYDELEYRYVWGDLLVGYGFLCFEGKENIYTASEDCETGYIDGGRVLSWRIIGAENRLIAKVMIAFLPDLLRRGYCLWH